MPLHGEFASQYPVDATHTNWRLFPRDIELRKKLFPDAVFDHPAKMNIFLTRAIIEHVSVAGDWVLDPFGGTGTSLIAATMGRNVVLTEVEDDFFALQQTVASGLLGLSTSHLRQDRGYPEFRLIPHDDTLGNIWLIKGDNRQRLPLSSGLLVDAVVTSPPYSSALKPSSDPLEVKGREGSRATYSASPLNMGNLNPFMWEQAMEKLWQQLGMSVKVGGIVAMVNKDVIKSGQRELLSTALIRGAKPSGFRQVEWAKWKTPSTIRQETNRNRGGNVIEDEDIIFFEKMA